MRRRLTVLLAAIGAAAFVGFAAIQFAASWLANRPDLSGPDELTSLRRAALLDPGNADYRYRLGRYYDLVDRDRTMAIEEYKQAVRLNPHSARYWFDLASAYQVLGDTPQQTAALEQAIHADSMTPDVAWEAGNFYLVQGENEKALREFSVVIANDPSLADAALQFCWRIQPDADILLHSVIPVRSDIYASFLSLLESRQETASTMKVWDALIQSRQSFERRHAFEYIKYLLAHKEPDEAELVWKQATNQFGLTSYLPSSSNLLVNGTFNLDVLNAGFDWQYQKQNGVSLTYDPSDFHAGRRSLQITFDGPGIAQAGIYQIVALRPNTAYDFSAYYKNGEMEGAGAAHFTVEDLYTQKVYYESEDLKEAEGFWKSVDGEFTTGPDCKMVVLLIRRVPEGSPIRGKLWVDDFHLTRKSS